MISLSAHPVAVVAGLILAAGGAGYLPAAQATPSEAYLIETAGSKHHYNHRDHGRHEGQGDHKDYGHRKGYGHDKDYGHRKGYGHEKGKGYGHDKGKGYGHHKDHGHRKGKGYGDYKGHGYDGKRRYSRHPYRYDRPYRDDHYGRYEYGDRYYPLAGIFDYLFGSDRHDRYDRDYDGRGRHGYH